jgi:small-conductance mechanosensitive channel
MKKFLVVFVFTFICLGSAFADNKARVDDLKKQQEEIVAKVNQAQQFIEQSKAQLLVLQGRIAELNDQDKSKVEDKTEKKEEKK